VWMSGLNPDWKSFYSNEERSRIPLPVYPFERKRYFVEPCRPGPFELMPMPEIGANEMENTMITSFQSSHPEDVEGEIMFEVPSGHVQATSRRDTLIATLRTMFQEMSGMNLEGADPALTFLEMGFDSLFLTQASQALKKKYGVKVTFRQMLEEVSTLNDLASHLDQKMPQEPLRETVTQQRKQEPAKQPSLKKDLPAVSTEGQPTSLVEKIMKQQLQIMAEQLEVLRNLEHSSQTNVAQSHTVAGKKKTEPAEMPPAKVETKFHGPFRPIEKGATPDLTPDQQNYLTDFIARYSKKTSESKRITQLHRKDLADPRAVAGFRQIWKEIVYPIVATRSAGSKIWDVDGNEYVDLTLGFGINLFGHSPAFVTEAIQRQLMIGVEIGPQTALAGEVAQMMREFTGMERITFCNTGSESVIAAMRVARTVTGRNKIVLFAGAYHGMFDEVLVRPGAVQGELRTSAIAPGIPDESLQNIIVLEYGAPESLQIIGRHSEDIAAVLVEPVQSRRPDLQPLEFLRDLRKLTTEKEIALVFDEVVTGFRVHPGGAQALFGIKADMATYGKVLGGGLPIGILTGNSSYMDALDGGVWEYGDTSFPETGVTFFAGTFVRHPLALAAARAVLSHLKQRGPMLQQQLNDKTTVFVSELNRTLEELGLPYKVPHFSSLFYVNFPSDLKYAGLFFHHLREKGVHLWEGRCGFLSTAHSEEDIQLVLEAFRRSAMEMQTAGFLPAPKPTGDDNSGPEMKKRILLSDAQKEVWLASQMGQDASCSFNESLAIHLKGTLNLDAIRQSLQEIVQRHEALRTTFSSDGDYQQISAETALDVPLIDLSKSPNEKRQTELTQLLMRETGEAFDLVSGPLLRAKLVRLANDHHILALTAHHIVCDGWSFGVILLELSKLYSAKVRGYDPNLEPQMQFSEYVQWQNRQDEEQKDSEEFWLHHFKEPAATVDLPTDRPRPSLKTYRGAQERIIIDQELQAQLKKVSSHYSSTFFATLLSAFLTLLYRFTGQDDLVVGVPAAGQAIAERKSLIGHCVNLLPLRMRVQAETKFCDFLKLVKRALLEAYEHQNFTFGTLVQKLNLPRDPSRIPLLTTTFNVDRVAVGLEFEGLSFEVETNPKISLNFETKFNLVEREDKLLIECDYNLDLFDRSTIRRWLEHFETLLRGIVSNPEQPIAKLPLMTEEELNQILVQWNRTEAAYPSDRSIQEVFEAQAKQFAKKTALVFGTQEMSYAEMNSKANQLAHHLRRLGVQPETRIGICVDRSIELIVGLLAILKAGGCYVPLDPDHPNERLSYQLTDTGAAIVLVQERYAARFSKTQTVRIDSSKEFVSQPATNPSKVNSGDHLAYVMYTSGSTGKPKGVMVPHRAVLRLVKGTNYADFNPEQSFLQFAPVTFDASTFEIWGALLNGGRLVVAPPENLSLSELAQCIERNRITTLWLTAGLFHQMVETQSDVLREVDQLLAGGDVLSPIAVKKILAMKKAGKLMNGYGPTENTTFTCCYPMTSPEQIPDTVPIGRPISNTKIYILDRNLEPVPIGIPGELHIGGAGLAHGYLNAPELNREKFILNSFENGSESKLYKSGDLARYLPDGNIEFLGRIDNQVKIRGFRVEPGEIEFVLSAHPSVRECSVIVREDIPQDKRLVAYVVRSGKDLGPKELKTFSGDRLPDYMVPSAIVFLDELPLTPNGKVDRNALPLPQDLRPDLEQAFIGPRNETEEAVAEIWTKVLRLNQVGIHDNFFELGGHSLLATQVLSRLRDVFQVDLPLRSFFEVPTIAALADHVITAKENGGRLQSSAILNVARDTHRVKRSSI
jgi:amino acid adenylation domain-containing protein